MLMTPFLYITSNVKFAIQCVDQNHYIIIIERIKLQDVPLNSTIKTYGSRRTVSFTKLYIVER